MAFEAILASVAIPAAVDLLKSGAQALTRRFVGLSVDDQIKLDEANIKRAEALAALDNPHGTPSQWVVNLRGSFRYVAAAVLTIGGAGISVLGAIQKDAETINLGFEVAGMPFGFIFGERMTLAFRGSRTK